VSLIPWWVRVLLAAVVVAAGVTACKVRDETLREEGREDIRAAWTLQVQAAQELEDRRKAAERQAQKEAHDAHVQTVDRLAADAAAARGAAERLRAQLAAYLAAGGGGAAPGPAAPGGAPATAAGDYLLAELLRESDDRAGALARALDASHAAGQLCERTYDALTD
jgi:hypothetical protein